MSSRPHGRGMRGGHHPHQHQHHGGYGHRGGQWMHKGGNRGNRSDYHHQHNHGGGRSPRPGMRHADPEKLLASLGPDAQLALTTAIINSVLKTSEDKDPRGGFRDNREPNYRNRDNRREGRGGYYKEEMRPRRPYGEPRRYDSRWHNEEGRGHHFEREKVNAGSPRHQYGNRYPPGSSKRRLSPQMHPGPTYKRQRMDKVDPNGGERDSHRDLELMEDDGLEGMEHPRERERHTSGSEEERGHRNMAEGMEGESGPSGVQVTIRADGERAVNSDGHVRRVAGRLFVELRCPHCPNQKSITFKEYKMHLISDYHKSRLQRLARKHTVVLRKIRVQQRQQQRDIENKWREENPEEFKTVVSRFCNACKLAFKCLGSNTSEGINQHNRSKLHRMQRHYLHPRCGLCCITFPTRMEYERHVASINHLRFWFVRDVLIGHTSSSQEPLCSEQVRVPRLEGQGDEAEKVIQVRTATIDQGGSRRPDDRAQEEEGGDLDLANFMTLDSVGEDDEEGGGSEHEEITGGVDAAEAQDKEVTGAEDDDLDSISGQSNAEKSTPTRRGRETKEMGNKSAHREEEEEEDEDMLETEWDKEQHEDEEEEGHQPLGTEYVRRIEAYYCSLCYKIIRADSSLGSRAVQRHCRSFSHLSHYRDHHPNLPQDEDGVSGEDGEGEVDLEEEQDQDKLWEEVDKGLTALQGEIMTEIEGEERMQGSKETEEEKKKEDENEDNEKAEDVESSRQELDDDDDINSIKKEEAHVDGVGDTNRDARNGEDWEEVGEDFSV
ncbi:hypothetical protein O3P69_005235 [Scylla paramamosain]|uniref:Uncharacterized protein n=1 Tax=Scylla paramamosain TaxID=85552 RepID=A0AAW0U8T9_SCYPA